MLFMLCVKTFKEINYEDSGLSWDEFQKLIDENLRFCENESKVFDFIGKCKAVDLPSCHPYWEHIVLQDWEEELKRHLKKYEECKKYPDKIKYHYNATTNFNDIEKRIEKLKNKIEERKSKLRY